MFSTLIQNVKQSNVFGILKYYIQGNMQDVNMEFFIVVGVLIVLVLFLGKLTNKIGKTNSGIFTTIFFLLAAVIILTYTGILKINI